jgi:broad specificity phosphatase PhoE
MRIDALRLRGIAMLMGLAAAMHASAAPDKLAGLATVLGELRKGGLVIYFRHALTDQKGATDEEADLAKCATQRNLSAAGRAQATQIGTAFHTLGIPVGLVATSPFCRCKDTAKLAFGRFDVSDDLFFAIGTNVGDTERFARSLRRMLGTMPAPATNTVIVSHTANLREAAGIWPKAEGVAYVFRPWPGGAFEAIAMVMPDDWAHEATLKSSGTAR